MNAKKFIEAHEGYRTKPYKDAVGVWTVGIGHNLENDMPDDVIQLLFMYDFQAAEATCRYLIQEFDSFDEIRKTALLDMAFNLGLNRLSKFKRMIDAVNRKDWHLAALEAQDSKWFRQHEQWRSPRARRIVHMIRTGEMI